MASAKGFAGIAQNASVASWAVRDLNRAFLEFEQTGQVSLRTISSLVGFITRINPAAGAAAEGIYLLYASFQEEKIRKQTDELNILKGTIEGYSERLVEAYTHASDGAGQFLKLHDSYYAISEDQIRIRDQIKGLAELYQRYNQAIKDHDDLLAKDTKTQIDALVGSEKLYLAFEKQITDREHDIIVNQDSLPLQRLLIQQDLDEAAANIKINESYASRMSGQNAIIGFMEQMILVKDKYQTKGSFITPDLVPISVEISKIEEKNQKLTQQIQTYRELDAVQGTDHSNEEEVIRDEIQANDLRLGKLREEQKLIDQIGAAANDAIAGTGRAAFDAFSDAMERSLSLSSLFSEQTGKDFRKAEAAVLKSLGEMATVHMLEELALAATTALNPAAVALYGPPSQHLEAAGMWAAVAVAAGVGAGALSQGTGTGSGPGGKGSTSSPPLNLSVTVIGTLDARQAEDLYGQLQNAAQTRRLV